MKTNLKLLAIHGSPRPDGHSSTLHSKFIDQFISAGALVNEIHVYDMKISPCTACGACGSTYACPVKDDMQQIYPLIMDCDVISVSTPLYFSSFPSQLKSLIDRCQIFWAIEAAGSPSGPSPKKAAFICTAGSEYSDMFAGVIQTVRHFFKTINASFKVEDALLIPGMDQEKKITLEIINQTVNLSESIITGYNR